MSQYFDYHEIKNLPGNHSVFASYPFLSNDKLIEGHIQKTIDLSKQAITQGDSPFAALLVDLEQPEKVLMMAKNSQYSENNPIAHAEMNLLRDYGKSVGHQNLSNLAMFVNAESCGGCANFYLKFKLKLVVFGAKPELKRLYPRESLRTVMESTDDVVVIGGVLATEAKEIIEQGRAKQSKELDTKTIVD